MTTQNKIPEGYSITVETSHDIDTGVITTRVGDVLRQCIDTQKQQVKDALIALGWTPPKENKNELG